MTIFMSDLYCVECLECGYQSYVVLEKLPEKDEKIICDVCKKQSESLWY